MEVLKSNFYNVLIPVNEENEFLLYNTLSGGLIILSSEQGDYLQRIIDEKIHVVLDDLAKNAFLSGLFEQDFLIVSDRDEQQEFYDYYNKAKEFLYERSYGDLAFTIGTTITCNMGCPYCFEFIKPNKTFKDEANIAALLYYIKDVMAKAPIKTWRSLNITWYGGEPMINSAAIEKITPLLLEVCEQNNMSYSASIITNGLLLDEKGWDVLVRNKVTTAQVTIDGPEELHNVKRPLKVNKGENYTKILKNLSKIPDGIVVTIRINVDKKIAASLGRFMDDLYDYGIWPQKYQSFDFNAAWLRDYNEIHSDVVSEFLTNEEFFEVNESFRRDRLYRFNSWAEQDNLPKAKLKWQLPSLVQDCSTWVSPYNIVIDPEGYIQKCWETIHDEKEHIKHLFDGFEVSTYSKYMEFDKTNLHNDCRVCQYLPICDKLPCAKETVKPIKPPCTYWKEKLPSSFKNQYILSKHHPEIMTFPVLNAQVNTGHSLK